MIKKNRKNKKFMKALLLSVLFLVFTTLVSVSKAQVDAPTFPSCSTKIFEVEGDWMHYNYGVHGIPGIGNLEGSDDVYSLSSGNFLQCFCSAEGDQGYQTDWWYIGASGLSEDEINTFISNGWFLEQDGKAWNLFDGQYLAKNIPFSCSEPTPTPTPTITPTPTSTPTPTPHDEDEDESRCVGLSASPSNGTAPLTVKFTGSGFDKNGEIKEYEFNFGDASGFQPQAWKQESSEAAHRYENPGKYIASLKVKDQAGIWRDGEDDCKVEIDVNGEPQVLGDQTPTQLPETGVGIVLAVVAMGAWGIYLYKRFRLV